MPRPVRKFIRGAIQHKGSLHRFATKHHALNKDGTINLTKARRAAMRLPGKRRTHRLHEISLAHTLRSFHKR